ncbi:hypothetical protein PkoCFBP13504_02430 [Pseudomonas koreensis]|nr:hypothetical protein PkoCFBP13504_02430 [Pseudomonas koreensis]
MKSRITPEAWVRKLLNHRCSCGSEPARESGVPDTLLLNVSPPSRAGSLPQCPVLIIGSASRAASAVVPRRCARRRTDRSGLDCRSGS